MHCGVKYFFPGPDIVRQSVTRAYGFSGSPNRGKGVKQMLPVRQSYRTIGEIGGKSNINIDGPIIGILGSCHGNSL